MLLVSCCGEKISLQANTEIGILDNLTHSTEWFNLL